MEQKEKKLQVRNLRVSFRTTGGKVQAVRDISFDLHKGETLAIVGNPVPASLSPARRFWASSQAMPSSRAAKSSMTVRIC